MTGSAEKLDYESGAATEDRLELRLWLRLLTCSHIIETRVRQRLGDRFSTTLPRFDVLSQLDRVPGGLTMTALSQRLMVTAANLTGLIKHLAEEGLVERQTMEADKRMQLVRLTEAGRAHFRSMLPEHEAWIAQMLKGLSRRDMTSLHELLAKLKAAVAANEESP